MGKGVDGVVTCTLRDVPVGAALKAMLFVNGYTLTEQDGVLVVTEIQKKVVAVPDGVTPPKIVRKAFRIPYTGTEPELVASSGGLSGAAGGAAAGATGGRGGQSG